jgi:hypothetical protein
MRLASFSVTILLALLSSSALAQSHATTGDTIGHSPIAGPPPIAEPPSTAQPATSFHASGKRTVVQKRHIHPRRAARRTSVQAVT